MRILKNILARLKSWWMAFAHAVGWLNTRVLLSVFYFLVVAIPAVIMKIARKDPLQRRYETGETYWKVKEPVSHTLEQAKHQF